MSSDDSLPGLEQVLTAAGPVGVVRVLARHGFGTVEPGQILAFGDEIVGGALLRGALDAAAVDLARAAQRVPAVREAHVGEAEAHAAGLACAGGATLLGHPLPEAPATALAAALAAGEPAALVATADGTGVLTATGPALEAVVGSLGAPEADEAAVGHARGLLRRGATATERVALDGPDAPDAPEVLVDLWVPVPTVLCVGGGAIADALAAQAGVLGWGFRREDDLAGATAALASFTDADVLVLLDHDPAFDALLRAGLGARGFLGALGSRRTQAARRERLLAAGVDEGALARLHGPVGLDLGARTPAESAVSIVAEVLATRSGRAPGALGGAAGPIGV